jgi:hypothetical protein
LLFMVREIKSLKEIVKDAVGFAAISYPVYAGVAAMTREQTILDRLVEGETITMAIGMGLGKGVYELGSRLYQTYRASKENKPTSN